MLTVLDWSNRVPPYLSLSVILFSVLIFAWSVQINGVRPLPTRKKFEKACEQVDICIFFIVAKRELRADIGTEDCPGDPTQETVSLSVDLAWLSPLLNTTEKVAKDLKVYVLSDIVFDDFAAPDSLQLLMTAKVNGIELLDNAVAAAASVEDVAQ